jgi:hypothetical protein
LAVPLAYDVNLTFQPTTVLPAHVSGIASHFRPLARNAYLLSDAVLEASRRCTHRRTAHIDRAAIFQTREDGRSARALASRGQTRSLKNHASRQPLRTFPSHDFRTGTLRFWLSCAPCCSSGQDATLPVHSVNLVGSRVRKLSGRRVARGEQSGLPLYSCGAT